MVPQVLTWRAILRRSQEFKSLVSFHLRRTMSTKLLDVDTPLIPLEETKRFITDCLMAVGTPKKHAEAQAALLAAADYRGHYSHGMNRLDMYVRDIQSDMCDPKAVPKILKETLATAWVDGQNGLGAVIGNFCMNLAIQKAKGVGIGWVCTKGSNHYGIAGMYTMQAIDQGMLGMSFTNTSPFLCPTRSKGAALGTNPLSLGAPAKDGDSFVLDMATTAVAVGKIEMQRRKHLPIPAGWAQDTNGNIVTDADVAYKSGRLMPLGGPEVNSGYKGYGLAFLVEIFSGLLSGSAFGPHVRKWGDQSRTADLGQCFVAIDPDCFAPGFEGRLSELMGYIRSMEPVDPEKPVLTAGDPERIHMKAVDEAGGVRYVQDQWDTCKQLSEKLQVRPLQDLS